MTKQAYYKHNEDRALARSAREGFALQYALDIRRQDPGMGVIKIWEMYRREFSADHPVGRDKFEALMDGNGLKVRKRFRKPRTTDSTHGLPVYPDIAKDMIPTEVNQLWVSDITYIVIWSSDGTHTFAYLSLVLDAYSEEIIGWSLGATLSAEYPLAALVMAMARLSGGARPVHHSDRGCQYASCEYVRALNSAGMRISMTEDGNPKANAKAERINNTMKNELLKGLCFRSMAEAEEAIAKAVDFYNNRRPHMSVDMLTPAQAAKKTGPIPKRWTSYREAAIQKKKIA